MHRLIPMDDANDLDSRNLHGLQLAMDHLPVAVGIFTLRGRPIYVNRPFIELHGLSWRKDGVEVDFHAMFERGVFRSWKTDAKQHLDEMLAAIKSGKSHEADVERGDRIIHIHSTLLAGRFILTTQQDVTARVFAERQVSYLAHHDPLTHLLNRTGFVLKLKETIKQKKKQAQPFAMISLDLDHFKDVNDLYGHMAGDALLKETGARIRARMAANDFCGRLGGDEFILVVHSAQQPSAANLLANALQADLSAPVEFEGRSIKVSASMGIAVYPDHGSDRAMLVSNADMALYRSKREGRGRSCVFDAALDRRVSRDPHSRETQLQQAEEHTPAATAAVAAVLDLFRRA